MSPGERERSTKSTPPVIAAVVGVVVLLLLVGWIVAVRNRIVVHRNAAQASLQDIDVALEGRYDRLNAQRQVVKSAVSTEIGLILDTTALRTGRTIEGPTVKEKAELAGAIQQAERRTLSVESYPNMRSLENVEILQRTINEAEERLQAARRLCNGQATKYNNVRDVFPQNLIAGMLGHGRMDLFEISNPIKADPVDFEGFLD